MPTGSDRVKRPMVAAFTIVIRRTSAATAVDAGEPYLAFVVQFSIGSTELY